MNHATRTLLLALTTGLAVPAFAAPVGRLLASAGQITIVRAGQNLPASTGTGIETGDTLQAGDNSNAQVRMLDGALIAIRPNTTLRIDDYRFNQGGDKESNNAAVSLLRGGLRTITGAIGKIHPEGYKVSTPTATIGVRGTHYAARHCNNDCQNGDGSNARNGTYGQVFEGAISVANEGGSQDFAKDQVFFVLDNKTPPERLTSPPGLLSDKLAGQSKGDRSNSGGANANADTLSRSSPSDDGRLIPPDMPRNELPFKSVDRLDPSGSPTVVPTQDQQIQRYCTQFTSSC